jgi:PilZ domain-containing protein
MRTMPGWVPRDERDEVSLSGSVRLADGRVIPVSVIDLSRAGCRILSEETLAIGSRVTLNVAPAEGIEGKVRWALQGAAGLRFDGGDWT